MFFGVVLGDKLQQHNHAKQALTFTPTVALSVALTLTRPHWSGAGSGLNPRSNFRSDLGASCDHVQGGRVFLRYGAKRRIPRLSLLASIVYPGPLF